MPNVCEINAPEFNVQATFTTAEAKQTATRELHKFGGSSLADAKRFLNVASIIQNHCGDEDLFVVSAPGKTTNRLIEIVELCGKDPFQARMNLITLREYQLDLINGSLDPENRAEVAAELLQEIEWIHGHLDAAVEPQQRDRILGHGEVWSARLLSALLNQMALPSDWLDARTLLRAECGAQPVIDEAESGPRVRAAVSARANKRVVITGYMAADAQGNTILLGRNGSDYSATMLGILAGSKKITIWSDVDGVFSGDPRVIEAARLVGTMSVLEANELASLGAGVLHRRSLEPVIENEVSVGLRSSFNPEKGSTTLHRAIEEFGPKVVTSTDSVCVVTVSSPSGESSERIVQDVQSALKKNQLQAVAVQSNGSYGSVRFAFLYESAEDATQQIQSLGFSVVVSHDHVLVGVVGAGTGVCESTQDSILKLVNEFPNMRTVMTAATDLSFSVIFEKTDTTCLVTQIHDLLFLDDSN